MAGMQFEYDEKGGTFYYFLLSFLALVLIPATYYLWPTEKAEDDKEKKKRGCQCEPCQIKRHDLQSKEPWRNTRRKAIKIGFIVAWIALLYLGYTTSQVELDFKEFDPYAELDIDRGATNRQIKKAYHQLSLIYHPDKETGDSKKFMRISKAYQALTDDEARENWEKYGNPDGPGATHFGIALPKWIVEKQNSMWVLAVYGLIFMVILPVVVGMWWYRSIKYSPEQILMDTTQLYFYFFNKTPNMMLKRVIMVLAGSMEFERGHNSEIVERPSDNEEIPVLMRDLSNLNEKNKEKPLCFPYSVKARALIYAHLSRVSLPPNTLEKDKLYVIKKSPYLLNEIVNILAQLVAMAHAGRASKEPRLDTIENVMKLSQMIAQAMWDNKSPLLQLPHITQDTLKYFVTKSRSVRSIRHIASMNEEDRRLLLRSLSDDEYRDIMCVLASMPNIVMKSKIEVLGEDDNVITCGSIVTVTVSLKRESLCSVELEEQQDEEELQPETVEPDEMEEVAKTSPETPQKKAKVWEKQKKKKKGAPNKKKKTGKPAKKAVTTLTAVSTTSKEDESDSTANGTIPQRRSKKDRRPAEDSRGSEDEADSDLGTDEESDPEQSENQVEEEPEDDEDDWKKFQEEAKKDNMLETKSKETHIVHSPYYPAVKHEWWWLYIADRRSHLLITAPVQVCSLKHTEEIQLKFSAPRKIGMYSYSVCLKSDSYLDFDQTQQIRLEVKEAKKMESHPQWEISDEEEEKENDDGSDSEGSSDYDSEDDE